MESIIDNPGGRRDGRASPAGCAPPCAMKTDKLPRSLRDHTGFLITDVGRLYRTALDRSMERFGLTRSQWWLISFLIHFDGGTQQELADVMDVGRAAIAKLLDRLEDKGLVRRVADVNDARSKRVFLSEHVRPLVLEVEAEIDRKASASLEGLTRDEVTQLNSLVKHIRGNLLRHQDD